MSLTPEEKTATRHHLGYLGVAYAYTFVFGIPSGVQTQFSVEGAMDRLLADSEPRYRQILRILDRIDGAPRVWRPAWWSPGGDSRCRAS